MLCNLIAGFLCDLISKFISTLRVRTLWHDSDPSAQVSHLQVDKMIGTLPTLPYRNVVTTSQPILEQKNHYL